MHLDEYLEALGKSPDDKLKEFGVYDNFTVFMNSDFKRTKEHLARQFNLNFEYPDTYSDRTRLIFLQFSDECGGGTLTCPVSHERLADHKEGLIHLNKQRTNYTITLVLHPNPESREREYYRAMAGVISQIGQFILENELQICIPNYARESSKFEDGLHHYDYSRIVYHNPQRFQHISLISCFNRRYLNFN